MTSLAIQRPAESYMEFVHGLKSVGGAGLNRGLEQVFQERARQYAQAHGQPPASAAEVAGLMAGSTTYAWQQFVARKSQEMMWDSFGQAVAPFREELAAELAQPNQPGARGSLTIDPDVTIPDWFMAHEIHIQPGGYHSNDLAGLYADWGSRIYHVRSTAHNPLHNALVKAAGPGPFGRILDLGTGIGGLATAVAEAHPEATTYAVDLGEPLLRYAHWRAERMGIPVHFSLQNAAELRFPDQHFDLIVSHIMFHEMPPEAIAATIREAYRVLRPGGTILLSDLPPYRVVSPYTEFFMRWQDENNGEPFWSLCAEFNIVRAMEEAGFQDVTERSLNTSGKGLPFPWVYTATRS